MNKVKCCENCLSWDNFRHCLDYTKEELDSGCCMCLSYGGHVATFPNDSCDQWISAGVALKYRNKYTDIKLETKRIEALKLKNLYIDVEES